MRGHAPAHRRVGQAAAAGLALSAGLWYVKKHQGRLDVVEVQVGDGKETPIALAAGPPTL